MDIRSDRQKGLSYVELGKVPLDLGPGKVSPYPSLAAWDGICREIIAILVFQPFSRTLFTGMVGHVLLHPALTAYVSVPFLDSRVNIRLCDLLCRGGRERRNRWVASRHMDRRRLFLIGASNLLRQFLRGQIAALANLRLVYADKAKGILTEQRFLRMTEMLEQEQADNKARMQAITDELRIASSADSDVRRFIGEIRKYASITEIDKTILNRLVDKIIVSAVKVVDGEKVQKVRIVYDFIGEITTKHS